jgi:hypothetical protein
MSQGRAMTADAGRQGDTRQVIRQYCIQKIRDIFRYGKWGKSLAGVGRWGLLKQMGVAFSAPRAPKHLLESVFRGGE